MPGRQLVGASVVGELFRIRFPNSRILVIAVGLTGDDLPFAVAPQPRVDAVITCRQILAEDGFGFIGVVAQNGGIADNPALNVADLNRARISGRQWRDVGDELGFIEGAAFFVGEDAVVAKYFFQGAWLPGTIASYSSWVRRTSSSWVIDISAAWTSAVANMVTSTSFITLNMGEM